MYFDLFTYSVEQFSLVLLTSLSDWSKKLAPLSQPIRYKTKTNQDLVARAFPRSIQFCRFSYFSFERSFPFS